MTPGQHRTLRANGYPTDIREERWCKPRKPRELNRLVDLLRACGVTASVERTRNDVPYVELHGRRVCWFHRSRVFRMFGPPFSGERYGDVRSGTAAAAFLLLGPRGSRVH